MPRYKTGFGVKHVLNGRYRNEPVTLEIDESEIFYYKVLTFAHKRGILDPLTAFMAEVRFFYEGYHWIDKKDEANTVE
jgi:hypothetical protein